MAGMSTERRRPAGGLAKSISDLPVTVAQYNPQAGYGFAVSDKGDVFVHRDAVETLGEEPREGATYTCDVANTTRGLTAISLRLPGNQGSVPQAQPRVSAAATASGEETFTGTVKFFDTEKGFGFVLLDHNEDVFLHARALEKSGGVAVTGGDRVRVAVGPGTKGPQVEKIWVL